MTPPLSSIQLTAGVIATFKRHNHDHSDYAISTSELEETANEELLMKSRLRLAVAAKLFPHIFLQLVEEPVRSRDRIFHVVKVFAVVLYPAGGCMQREDECSENRHRIARFGEVACVCVCDFGLRLPR
jgi:hypothetical protein